MNDEASRLYRLELQVTELQRQVSDERTELRDLRAVMDGTAKRINTAESWGRAVIWTTIALGGFATQFTEILTWLKRL